MLVMEKNCLFHPKLVRMRAQTIEEEIQRSNPSIEGLGHIGSDILDAFLFLGGPSCLGAAMVSHVEAVNHVVLDVLKDLAVLLLDIGFKVAGVIMKQEVSRDQGHGEHLPKQVHLVFIAFVDHMFICTKHFSSARIHCELPTSSAIWQNMPNRVFFCAMARPIMFMEQLHGPSLERNLTM